jgi:hypothetical protein
MYKRTMSASTNQPDGSDDIVRNDGESNVCIVRDETRVATTFYSPRVSAFGQSGKCTRTAEKGQTSEKR